MYFFIILAVIVIAAVWQGSKTRKENKLAVSQFENLSLVYAGFKPDTSFIHPNGNCYIAIDNTSKQVVMGSKLSKPAIAMAKHKFKDKALIIDHKLVNYNDIVKTEIIVDGQTVSSKSAAGALVGGALFGTTGAIIGSNTGTTTYSKKVNTIKLKLLINDIQTPSFELPFYDKKTDGGLLDKSQQHCQLWQDRLTVALR